MLADILKVIKKYTGGDQISLLNKEMWEFKKENLSGVSVDKYIWEKLLYNIDRKWFFLLLDTVVRTKQIRIAGDSSTAKMILDGLCIHLRQEEKLDNIHLQGEMDKSLCVERYKSLAATINIEYSLPGRSVGTFMDKYIVPADNVRTRKIGLTSCSNIDTVRFLNNLTDLYPSTLIEIDMFYLKYEQNMIDFSKLHEWNIKWYEYQFTIADLLPTTISNREDNPLYGDNLSLKIGYLHLAPMDIYELTIVMSDQYFVYALDGHEKIILRCKLDEYKSPYLVMDSTLSLLFSRVVIVQNTSDKYRCKIIEMHYEKPHQTTGMNKFTELDNIRQKFQTDTPYRQLLKYYKDKFYHLGMVFKLFVHV